MNRIQTQANKLWQIVSNPETAAAYQKVITLTWDIIRETGILLWLVVCLLLVAFEWLWHTGFKAGYAVRGWFNNLGKKESDEVATDMGKALINAGQNSLVYALTQAKTQLGIPVPAEAVGTSPVAPTPTKPVEAPKVVETPKASEAPKPVSPPVKVEEE